MGWTIGYTSRRPSYLTITNLGQQLAHVLTSAEWRTVQPLFARRDDERFTVPAVEAARMAEVLRSAAWHRLMPLVWADLALNLAAAATRAAGSRQPWIWR